MKLLEYLNLNKYIFLVYLKSFTQLFVFFFKKKQHPEFYKAIVQTFSIYTIILYMSEEHSDHQ